MALGGNTYPADLHRVTDDELFSWICGPTMRSSDTRGGITSIPATGIHEQGGERTMREWGYKAAKAGVSADKTREIATKGNFICRNPYRKTGGCIGRVKDVQPGDRIRLYFVDGKLLRLLAVLTVLPGNTIHHERTPVGSIYRFNCGECSENIRGIVRGMPVDPILGYHCGFVVESTSEDEGTFGQDQSKRPVSPPEENMNTIFEIDDGHGWRRAGF
jgi:hypothetical protein